ncbi:MAG TPA: metallophosphoesterase family protein [Planctomycetota bacterium]|nr:metallophosphoesterase family protein [Planctomycetota bacterium]
MAERVAIISDIHANLEALKAVLADIAAQGASDVLCLGDVVGYGIDAEACIDLVQKRCSLCLCGNHDWAVLNSALGFNAMARQAIDLTRRRLAPSKWRSPARKRRWQFLEGLPLTRTRGSWLLVHGSPRDPVTEYIFPEDVELDPDKMEEIFGKVEQVCFVGHTHLPGIFTETMAFLTPPEVGGRFQLGEAKAVINVGSVGQPRDGDVRACYVQVEDDQVVYRRVPYDVRKTMEKIRASHLDAVCAERLSLGR